MLSLLHHSKIITENIKERKKEREELQCQWAVIIVVTVPICSCCVHYFKNVISRDFGGCSSHEECRLCRCMLIIIRIRIPEGRK